MRWLLYDWPGSGVRRFIRADSAMDKLIDHGRHEPVIYVSTVSHQEWLAALRAQRERDTAAG